ncbi:hypothetical protein MBLNU13_g04585t1 [Cladosporium sp. NU13]
MSHPKSLAFFGATGDCAGYCLALALKNQYTCTALARTPSKLTASLTAKGVSAELQARHLTIIHGDIRDPATVAQVLKTPTGQTVDVIISGVGPTSFYLHPNPLAPVGITDSTLVRDASRTILAALPTDTPAQNKPLLINVTTTGIPPPGAPRDVPLLYLPLYRWLLHHPHVDKGEMEANLRAVMGKSESERPIRGFVNVKPTLLTDGEGKGWERIRSGQEGHPALGYFVARKDVGEWVFERLIGREAEPGWINGGVTLAN